jgi:maltose alpha-D-glucosyltransferase / alpha-amylase
MPGTPVLRYGEQVGMSEGLSLPGREELRTAMQWDDRPADGVSTATEYLLVRPAISRGRLGARKVNVRTQQRDPHSLMAGSTR